MSIRVVRLGSPRGKNEGLRIGTVRRPPRGVRKADYGARDFYDVWLPQLAPSAKLVRQAKTQADSPEDWKRFEKQFTRELLVPDSQRLLDLLAALSKETNFSIGCYCENEERCHRSVLKKLLRERGALIH